MPTEMLTKNERKSLRPVPTTAALEDELGDWARKHVKRVRRFKINAVAWALGTTVLTALWVINEWQANGAFERFGNEGNPGDWSPTLWALAVGFWGLIVAIMALRVYLRRPATEDELRRFTRARIERTRRLKFHLAAWALGVIVLTPLWALIEWQDNGGFERWSDNSRPGSWDPWILWVALVWAVVAAVLVLKSYFDLPPTERKIDRELRRLRSGG